MVSKSITLGVGIPMIIVGVLMAWLWSPIAGELQNQVELIGSTIGILGVGFLYFWIILYKRTCNALVSTN